MINFKKYLEEKRYGLYSDLDLEEGPDGIAAKAKKSGISPDTLRKVYNRGVAAWKTGHRPAPHRNNGEWQGLTLSSLRRRKVT